MQNNESQDQNDENDPVFYPPNYDMPETTQNNDNEKLLASAGGIYGKTESGRVEATENVLNMIDQMKGGKKTDQMKCGKGSTESCTVKPKVESKITVNENEILNLTKEKLVDKIQETFTILKNNISPSDNVIWMHCASLGEFDQGLPVLWEFKSKYPEAKILVTFFSPSGLNHYHKRAHCVDQAQHTTICDLSCVE